MDENMTTTVVAEENATETESANIFDSLTKGFQGIIDLIMKIIDTIRGLVENITGKQ